MKRRAALVTAAIAMIFIVSLALQLGAIFWAGSEMWPEEMQAALVKLLGVYSIPLSTILAGIFANDWKDPRPAPLQVAAIAGLSLLWNALFLLRTSSFLISSDASVEALTDYFDTISSSASFLVVAGLTYFFASRKTRRPDGEG